MIQFNLLPDVKIEYLKARRTKRMVILVASIITIVSLVILVSLFIGVNVVQRGHMNNLKSDIDSMSNQLQNEPDIDKILTVQNQLNSLNSLHENKPASERMGSYLPQIVPSEVTVSSLDADFTANTMTFEGAAPSLKAVNEFVDTLKFTDFQSDGQTARAFSSVVLSSFAISDEQDANKKANYKITLAYDPIIFTATKDVELIVPKTITTRSSTEKPAELFETNGEGVEE